MTVTIRVEIDEQLAEQFREKAIERFGNTRGAMKKALVEAIRDYSSKPHWVQARTRLENPEGILTSDKDSVWLQHHAWDHID